MFKKIKQKINAKLVGRFEVDQKTLKLFCEKNKKIWDKLAAGPENAAEDRGTIFIGLFMVEKWITWLQPKMLYAKGLEKATGCRPVVTDWEYNEDLIDFYASYGISYLSMKQEMFQNMAGCLYGIFRAAGFFLFGGSGKKMAQLTYQGMEVGHFMFDTIIRTNKDIYTVRNARTKTCIKKIWTGFWTLHTLSKVCKKYNPKYYFYDDLVFDEGMMITLLKSKGVEICSCGLNGQPLHMELGVGEISWTAFDRGVLVEKLKKMSKEEKEEYIQAADELLLERFQAKNGDERDSKAAFIGKKDGSKEELEQYLHLHKGRKNVVVCCHTLSECAHCCNEQVFEDTYTWVEETMKMVRDKENANWIIKEHPIAEMKYGETGIIKGLFDKYKSDNMFLFPNEYNSALIGQLADVVITIYGTVGCEYSCLGIPVVLAGKAVYSGFGYTVDAFTREKYEQVLDRIQDIEPLNEEQTRKAKLIFTYQNRRADVKMQDFTRKMIEYNWKMDTAHMNEGDIGKLNSEVLSYIMEHVTEEELYHSDYYTAGFTEVS